jgi:hypothetical protein
MAKTKGTKRQATTRDERDVRLTAAERRKRDEAAAQQAQAEGEAAEAAAGGSDEEVDNDLLPINHQTIMDHRDVEAGRLPPEATPREGRTSPAPPIGPGKSDRTRVGRGPNNDLPDSDRAERSPRTRRRRLVQATQLGYYAHARRRPGDVFEIEFDEEFSERWMRDAPRGSQLHTTGANEAIRQSNRATRDLRAGVGAFPTAPNAAPPTNVAATRGVDQAVEADPLND